MVIPTLTNFVIPFKRINDSSFNLIDPSSNSPGAFVFTSGSPQVATIIDRTVTIVGIGATIITATQQISGIYESNFITASFIVKGQIPTISNFVIPTKTYGNAPFLLTSPISNSQGAFTYISANAAIATINNAQVTILARGTTYITATQEEYGIFDTADISAAFVVLPPPPTWSPDLLQNSNGDLIIPTINNNSFWLERNIYALQYSTTIRLNPIDVARLPNDIRSSPYFRSTGVGVIPMIEIFSNNTNPNTPILYDCPGNSNALTFVHLNEEYITGQLIPTNDPRYRPEYIGRYRDVVIINGLIDENNTIIRDADSLTLTVFIRQAAGTSLDGLTYVEKVVYFPFTITLTPTIINLKSIATTPLPQSLLGPGGSGYIIQREYLDLPLDLSFSQFATTSRKSIRNDADDYTNVYYYLFQSSRDNFILQNEYISIQNNRINFLNATYAYNVNSITDTPVYNEIPILFYQESTAFYKRSEFIGDSNYSPPTKRETIKLRIVKSTPTFIGQTPEENTSDPTTQYKLANITKMTYDEPFEIIPPQSNNTDSNSNFTIVSSAPQILTIKVVNGKNMAYIYDAGVVTLTITQQSTRNFKSKTATLLVYINLIAPSLINCNTNIVYTNPYQREFWTRYKPPCPDYKLTITNSAGQTRVLTPNEVDELYSERRKTEILKYTKNVGGLTKSQKYAKAARGELMRQIGNENKYLVGSNGNLVCPIPSSRVYCGLTSACGVPGKERVLCFDPSINLYNYTRTYEYKAGLQTTSNIPTLALTPPRNLVAVLSDNNRVILTWDSPISNGGIPITGYVISFSINNKIWIPYTSIFPNANGPIDPLSGERNANTVIFQDISGSIKVETNTLYYMSVFSANERGLSSVPATATIKTSSSPSIISDFGLLDDDRKYLIIDLKWTDPKNDSFSSGGYIGPPISQYAIQYKKVSETTWATTFVNTSSVITEPPNTKKYSLRNLENESTYNLKIEPINSVGKGAESRILTARTLMKPSPPLNIACVARYGVPPANTGISSKINYITVTWTRPDNGGSVISSYNITIVDNETKLFNVSILSQPTTYTYTITTLNSRFINSGTNYSIALTSKNSNFTSISSAATPVFIEPITSKLTIIGIDITYVATNLTGVFVRFAVGSFNYRDNPITNIRVSGLGGSGTNIYETTKNSDNIDITGSGEHKIFVPYVTSNILLLQVGNVYNITINARFGSSSYTDDTRSESFRISPSIRL